MLQTSGLLLGAILFTTTVIAAPCPSTSRPPQTFFVSPNGNPANADGTVQHPFSTVQAGIDCAAVPGDHVYIFGGTYTELLTVRLKNGAPGKPITIEGAPGFTAGPVVNVDGGLTALPGFTYKFHQPNNGEWVCASGQSNPCQEYVSVQPLINPTTSASWFVSRGGFVDPINGQATRLITYSRREDLQAENQTDELITEGAPPCPPPDSRAGPVVGTKNGCTLRRPWFYMGPGLWFDTETNHVHIRLSPTANHVPGLADYAGPTDPNTIGLVISEKATKTLTVQASSHILFKNLNLRFGGETVRVEGSNDIVFQGVNIYAGQYGVRSGAVTSLKFSDCVLDGGLPPWLFRSDIKDQYDFTYNNQIVTNKLAQATAETLVLGNGDDDGTEFDHCEFTNAHDLYLVGNHISFHHNWISNLNDESLFLDDGSVPNGVIHDNVILQTTSAISFAGLHTAGPWRIYRNLIDLRRPVATYRPRRPGIDPISVWRVGRPFKSNEGPLQNGVSASDGAYDLFQNTFIFAWEAQHVSAVPAYPGPPFDQFRASVEPWHLRRSFNNLFVVLNREPDKSSAMAFLPLPDFPAELNGNLYHWRGFGEGYLFYTPATPPTSGFQTFRCTPPHCRADWLANPYFQQSRTFHFPGYEADSLFFTDPQFVNWSGEETPAEDLRLQPSSPARSAGVVLPSDLKALDQDAPPANPDIGCYQAPTGRLALKLRVGVSGGRVYPQNGPGQ